MEKLNFSKRIKATKEKVWAVLWDKDTYRKWTRVFAEGSDVVTDWTEGGKVLFVDGKGEGMVSKIKTSRQIEHMVFEHLGMIKAGVEDTQSDEVKKWAGALESYTLKEENGETELYVEMDISADHKDYFLTTWPKALDTVKTLSE